MPANRPSTTTAGASALASGVTLVATIDRRPAGLAGGLPPDIGHGPASSAWLVSMWVHPSRRGRGIGAALVLRVIEWAGAEGYPELRLWVSEGNTPAERLYTHLGFTETGELQPIRPGEPRLEAAMARDLRAQPPPT